MMSRKNISDGVVVLMIFRTPREELLGQKVTFMSFEKHKVTLGVYNVN